MTTDRSATRSPCLDTRAVLQQEFDALWPGERPGGRPFTSIDEYGRAALAKDQAALCLSGGGIRSAAFGLGVLQALAAMNLLSRFQYLSTVSGGGYIGSWLQRWLHACAEGDNGRAGQDPVRRVEAELAGTNPEARQVAALREHSNFLNPRIGLSSIDSWAAIVIVARNLLLNWTVFLPFLVMAATPTNFYLSLVLSANEVTTTGALVAALALLFLATYQICMLLPSHRRSQLGHDQASARNHLQLRVVWPALASAMLLPVWLAHDIQVPVPPRLTGIAAPFELRGSGLLFGDLWSYPQPLQQALVAMSLPFALLWLVLIGAYLAAMIRSSSQVRDLFRRNLLVWAAISAIAAAFVAACVPIGWQMFGDAAGLRQACPAGQSIQDCYGQAIVDRAALGQRLVAALAPFWITLGYLLCSALFVGFRRASGLLSSEVDLLDADREWLARISAMKVVPAVMWAVFALICLPLPRWILAGPDWPFSFSVTMLATGIVSVFGGKSTLSSLKPVTDGRMRRWLTIDILVAVTTFVFLAALFLTLAYLELKAAVRVARWLETMPPFIWRKSLSLGWLGPLSEPMLLGHLVILAVLAPMLWLAGRRINVNQFSLHGMYRNRLIRAFLGSARAERLPNAATGFDEEDNVQLHQLDTRVAGRRVLFPVINATMNLTDNNTRLGWQERKAASFILTPFACGSASLPSGDSQAGGAYVESACYAGSQPGQLPPTDPGEKTGITLGGAMTISGAAVSPAMGYHSSPATAFLMTLFNVRLGVWVPNPGYAQAHPQDAGICRQASPGFAILPFLNELLGRAGAKRRFVYLSDGGHFENLGLYEMIRRRCRFIILSDAAADPDCRFGDLGNAVRKIKIDLGVDIEFLPIRIAPRGKADAGTTSFALGRISYPEAAGDPERCGWLLYLKPTYLEDLPVDVRAYAAANSLFPHEPTSDQWFSESQFESYRRLGEHLMSQFRPARQDQPVTLEALFLQARARLLPGPAASSAGHCGPAGEAPGALDGRQTGLEVLLAGPGSGPIPAPSP